MSGGKPRRCPEATGTGLNNQELITMGFITMTTGAVLAATAFTGAGATHSAGYAEVSDTSPPTATATAPDVNSPMYSRGFLITNLTSTPMTLKSVTGDDHFEGRPEVGSVLQPGQTADFEVQWRWLSNQNNDITYSNGTSSVDARLTVWGADGTPTSTCSTVSGRDQCTTNGGTSISILEPAGTVVNIDGANAQAQAAALKQYCEKNPAASCTFTPTSETRVKGPQHVLAGYANNGSGEGEMHVTQTDTVSATNSVDISASVGANIAEIVDVQVTAAYGHSWSTSHAFETGVSHPVPAGYYGEITAIAPMIRDTGNFTIKIGNTTINLTGVYFDTADPNGGLQFGYTERPLTPEEKATLPKEPSYTML
jgi:hypothetical protein